MAHRAKLRGSGGGVPPTRPCAPPTSRHTVRLVLGNYTGTVRFMATPQAWADAWATGVGGASQKYTDGIQNTTVDVAGRAIANQGALLANFTASVTSGEWARRLAAVGTQGWKSAAIAKAQNYVTGAAAGKTRFQNFAQQAQPFWANASAAIDGMASGNKAAAMARVGAWYDAMQTFKQSYTP